MPIEIFSRREQKYLITRSQYLQLVDRVLPYMRPDKYGVDGRYSNMNLVCNPSNFMAFYATGSIYN